MKLIKIAHDHYIIVDDSKIQEGDYYLFTWGGEQEIQRFSKEQYADRENHRHLYDNACKKITHSTQPLEQGYGCEIKEGLMLRNVGKELCYDLIKPLSLSEVKELIGEVDVEKNMWYKRNVQNPYPSDSPPHTGFKKGFEFGYNQALEDNKGKVYTEEDLFNAIGVVIGLWSPTYASFEEGWKLKILQSLQPKTEWEVEFVYGKLALKK